MGIFSIKKQKPRSVHNQESIEESVNAFYKDGPFVVFTCKGPGFSANFTIPLPDKQEVILKLKSDQLDQRHALEKRELEQRFNKQQAPLPTPSPPVVPKKRKTEPAASAPKRIKSNEVLDPAKPKGRRNSYMLWNSHPEVRARLKLYYEALPVGLKKEAFEVWSSKEWNRIKKENTPEYQHFKKLAADDAERAKSEKLDWDTKNAAQPFVALETKPSGSNNELSMDDSEEQQIQKGKSAELRLNSKIETRIRDLFQHKREQQLWLQSVVVFDKLWKSDDYFKFVNFHLARLWQVSQKPCFTRENLEALIKHTYSEDIVATVGLVQAAQEGPCSACSLIEHLFMGFKPTATEEYPLCHSCREALELVVEFMNIFRRVLVQARECHGKPVSQALIEAVDALIAITVQLENFKFTK